VVSIVNRKVVGELGKEVEGKLGGEDSMVTRRYEKWVLVRQNITEEDMK
jgi:hypothetical protein